LTRIFLIRHAEAEGNIHRRAHGQFNGQITAGGYVQMGLLRERFKNERIDAIYSSDQTRARVTATALSETRGLEIVTSEKLREIRMGEWEDVAWGDLSYYNPEMSANFNEDPANWVVNGSEAYADVVKRMTSFITETAKRHDGETAAFFSHGFAIRSFFCELMGFRSDESRKVKYCDNTAAALLFYDNDTLTIEYHGDNSHLSQETSTFARQKWWRVASNAVSENLRYVPLDERRDAGLISAFRAVQGDRAHANKEYTAFLADESAGFIGLDTDKESVDGAGWISSIYLKPDFRSAGFSVQLIGLAISEFRRLRREKLRIEAPDDNPAVKLCLRSGFEIISKSGAKLLLEKGIRNWD